MQAFAIWSTIDKTEVLGSDKIFADALVGFPKFGTGIVHVTAQDTHRVGEIRSSPNGQMYEFTMGLSHFCSEGCVLFALREIETKKKKKEVYCEFSETVFCSLIHSKEYFNFA